MKESLSIYQEGYSSLELDAGFFRPDSILARDFSVLFAAMQFHEKKDKNVFRLLDNRFASSGPSRLSSAAHFNLIDSDISSI